MPMPSLPDYLRDGLDIVFCGINPGWRSAQEGHYFATPRNRFWAAFNAAKMAPRALGPATGAEALRYGMGFTDVVKRATRQMAELRASDFREGAPLLREKLLRCQPLVVCFNGLSGYKYFLRYTDPAVPAAAPGLQAARLGRSRVYVLPSTSPANAAVSLATIVEHMRKVRALADALRQ